MKISNSRHGGPKINKKILCIPTHCGYFFDCHVNSTYPKKIEERKCLRYKHESQRPKMKLSIYTKKLLESY